MISINTTLEILNRLLVKIPDTFDKTKGSVIYDLLMPVAIELASIYKIADETEKKGFAVDCKEKDLERVCYEHGISRKPATKATGEVLIKGTVGAIVPKGELVSSESLEYKITSESIVNEAGEVKVPIECIAEGTAGNVPTGAVKFFPKTIQGLTSVYNNSSIVGGYNAEDDTALKDRYYTKVQTPATSGNVWHYLNWAKEVIGVGDARVLPLWNGNGTVKIIIINAEKQGASEQLINAVVSHVENNRPIGATVTVVSAIEKQLNIYVDIVLDSSYILETVKEKLTKNIKEYLKLVAFKDSYISIARIGNIIFSTEGVLDYDNLLINSQTENIPILESEVAVLGVVTVE